MRHLSDVRPGWLVASGLGGAAGAALFDPISTAVSSALGVFPASAMVFIVGGMLLGIGAGQGVVLRRISWTRSLLLAEMSGTALGVVAGVAALAVFRGVAGPGTVVALVVSSGWAAFATTQWLVLRGRVTWARQWALASATGLAAGLLIAGIFTYFFGHLIGGVLGTRFGEVGVALFRAIQGVALGIVYGGITGCVSIQWGSDHPGGSDPPVEVG